MKNILFVAFLLVSIGSVNAQMKCGTKAGSAPIIFSKKQKDSLNAIMNINMPYAVKIWVTVFADDNGSNISANDSDIREKIQLMSNQFQPFDICFMLMGINHVNNSDLNNHDAEAEEAELDPFKVSGCLNIFIHKTLPGLFGIAYHIPNTYLSMRGDVFIFTDQLSILAHEMGHCFGLYHTFETFGNTKNENVARNGDCKNCTTHGDVLCDTPADYNGPVNSACVFTGTAVDACGALYTPLTSNIMSYYNFCSDTFTGEQNSRMKYFLLNNASLNSFLVHDTIYEPPIPNSTYQYNAGNFITVARDYIGICQFANNIYEVSGSATQLIVSKKISLKPGTRLHPATGSVRITANPYCQ